MTAGVTEAPFGFEHMIFARLQLGRIVASQRRSKTITLTNEGIYTASSAYHTQFLGYHPCFLALKIWNVFAKLFAWLALHGKLLTTDMLAIRG
jgi:hypothetical protein